MFTKKGLKLGTVVVLGVLETTFLRQLEAKQLAFQRRVYDQDSTITVDRPEQYVNEDGSFKPNREQARSRAKATIEMGVGRRLEGAIALYEIGEQMECLRHLILALGAVFEMLEWSDASTWCNVQNTVLYETHKKKKAA